jgi:hypothetical protein
MGLVESPPRYYEKESTAKRKREEREARAASCFVGCRAVVVRRTFVVPTSFEITIKATASTNSTVEGRNPRD